jgi:prepilin-type N-terminal cleavage/methylation domain-containing protein
VSGGPFSARHPVFKTKFFSGTGIAPLYVMSFARSIRSFGMTLIEVVLTMALIGMLAAMMVPAFLRAQRSRRNAETAVKLRKAVEAFELFAAETGAYPPDQNVPGETTVAAMAGYYFPYFKIDWWGQPTELGGRWDWDVGYHGIALSVSIWNPSASAEQLSEFDRLIDDGNLETGRFRKLGVQYHYVIRE